MSVRSAVFDPYSYSLPGFAAPSPDAATLYDSSRYHNNGAFGAGAAAPTWTRLPSGLWVLDLEATNSQYISIANAPSLQFTTMTILAWINIESYAGDQHWVIGKYADGTHYCGLQVTSTGTILMQVSNPTGQNYMTSTAVQNLGTWLFLAGTATVTSLCSLSINTIVQAGATANPGGAIPTITSALEIGRRPVAVDDWYDGLIWRPRMYNYILTPNAIFRIFESEKAWFGVL